MSRLPMANFRLLVCAMHTQERMTGRMRGILLSPAEKQRLQAMCTDFMISQYVAARSRLMENTLFWGSFRWSRAAS